MSEPREFVLEISEKIHKRFWSKVNKSGPVPEHCPELGPCWVWTGFTQNGYGGFHTKGMQMRSHRVSWILANGQIPNGLCVMHKCDNRLCQNPSHLVLGTVLENIKDRDTKGRQSRGDTHSSRLHPERLARGDRNGSRLHPETRPRGDNHFARRHPELMPRGESSARSKLTEAQVLEIRRLGREAELTHIQIAGLFGISFYQVGKIVQRISWKHVA